MNKAKLILIFVICALLAGCGGLNANAPAATQPPETQETPAAPTPSPEPTPSDTPAPTVAPTPTPTPEPTEVNIMAVGDIMFHNPEIAAAYNKTTKSYNFDYSFQYVKDILGSADVAIGNFECTLGGKPYSYVNSKSFSAPDEAADALKNAGFDVLTTANNHMNDRGRKGVIRTVDVFRNKGIQPVGAREKTAEKPYIITDVKGIKIGFTGYTFGSSNGDIANLFSKSYSAKGMDKIKKVISAMRSDGAEVVVFFFHWGEELQRSPNSSQKKYAQALADAGVDIIFASHPHVLQRVDELTSATTGKKTLVAYSLGNFISNQRSKYHRDGSWAYNEDAMILNVKITKPFGGAAQVSSVEYLPTWTFMYYKGSQRYYTVVPLEKAVQSPGDFGIKAKYDKDKAQTSLNNTNKLMADAVSKGILSEMKTD